MDNTYVKLWIDFSLRNNMLMYYIDSVEAFAPLEKDGDMDSLFNGSKIQIVDKKKVNLKEKKNRSLTDPSLKF